MVQDCWCQHCKSSLSPGHTGPCPVCGGHGKSCAFVARLAVGLALSKSASRTGLSVEFLGIRYSRLEVAVLAMALAALGWAVGELVDAGLVGLVVAVGLEALFALRGPKFRLFTVHVE